MSQVPGQPPIGYQPVVPYPAGWYPDPWIADGMRYWDGRTWTGQVAMKHVPPAPPHHRLPLVVAVVSVVTLLVSLVASRYLLDWLVEYRWPIFVYVVVSGLVGYGPVLVVGWWASNRWGSGSLRADSGLYFRKADFGWGPVTWLACVASQVLTVVVIQALEIPLISNTEGVDDFAVDRGYLVSTLVLAVVVAPIVEEMLFRGLVLRGLLSAMGAWLAVAVQGVLFGLAHFDPVRGTGNIGLIMVLTGVGVVLGVAEYRVRRIGPTLVAHAIINAIAMSVALFVNS